LVILLNGARRNRFLLEPTLEKATYSCPGEKQGDSKSTPATLRDCPCVLFTVIAKETLIEN